jgi:hypothetical protein
VPARLGAAEAGRGVGAVPDVPGEVGAAQPARGREGEEGGLLARHVRPLLDALEQCADWMDDQGCDCGTDELGTCALCVARALLTEWKGKP